MNFKYFPFSEICVEVKIHHIPSDFVREKSNTKTTCFVFPNGQFSTRCHDKIDDFNFSITNFQQTRIDHDSRLAFMSTLKGARSTTVSSTNKTDRHDITEKILKVALNTINKPKRPFKVLALKSLKIPCV